MLGGGGEGTGAQTEQKVTYHIAAAKTQRFENGDGGMTPPAFL
jgi:hypothetical protein